MTVADLKLILSTHDDSEEILYFNSEEGVDVAMISCWLSFKESAENE